MSINKNVHLWIALDENKKYITIDKAVNNKDYYCCECGSILRARALNSDCISPHFYHISNRNCSCTKAIKQYWKEYLVGVGEIIYLPKLKEITIIDKRIDFELQKDDIKAKVDLMIKTIDKRFIIITFNNNSKYIDKLKAFEYPIFYIDVDRLKYNKPDEIGKLFEIVYIKGADSIKSFTSALVSIKLDMIHLNKNDEYYKANKFIYRMSKLLESIEDIKLKWLYNYTKDLFNDKWSGYVYHKTIKPLNELCQKIIEYKKNI